jgi:hypothetical protein
VPTRALAQDLRCRLEPILHGRLSLRLSIRTGDIKRLPAGQADVLLTTPESQDVMLGSPNREVRAALQRQIQPHLVHLQHEDEELVATLPLIHTVERLQGAERDVLLFSVITSDPDHFASPFLNNTNRFNVAITRTRHKLVVVNSAAFLAQVPHTDTALQAYYGFKAYYHRCREQDALFVWPRSGLSPPHKSKFSGAALSPPSFP